MPYRDPAILHLRYCLAPSPLCSGRDLDRPDCTRVDCIDRCPYVYPRRSVAQMARRQGIPSRPRKRSPTTTRAGAPFRLLSVRRTLHATRPSLVVAGKGCNLWQPCSLEARRCDVRLRNGDGAANLSQVCPHSLATAPGGCQNARSNSRKQSSGDR